MKKRYILMLLTAMMLSVTACGSKTEEAADSVGTEETAETEEATDGFADIVIYESLTSKLITLGEYKGIQAAFELEEVTDEDVQEAILFKLEDFAESGIAERPAQLGDTAVIDFTGYVDGEAFEGGQGSEYSLELGSGSFIPGFEDQLVGASAGEEVDVNVTFPDPYLNNPDLAGKDALFKVYVHEVQEKIYPELTDEFVKENFNFENEEAWRESVKAELEQDAENEAEQNYQYELVRALVESCEFDIQEADVKAYTDEMMNEYVSYAAQYGVDLEEFLTSYVGMDEASLRDVYKETATFRIQMMLVFRAIADAEGIEVSEEECKSLAQDIADQYGYEDVSAVEEIYPPEAFRDQLIQQKALELLVANAVR